MRDERCWQDEEFPHRCTVVFAAISEVGGAQLISNPIFPVADSDQWTVLILEGLGAGADLLDYRATSTGLEQMFADSASRMKVDIQPRESYDFFFSIGGGVDRFSNYFQSEYEGIVISWCCWLPN